MEKKTHTTARHSLKTVRKVRAIVKGMNALAHGAKEKREKVAYCMVACNYDEILKAMDIVPVWTENYAGLCAAKRDGDRFIQKAEEERYAESLCGYARIGLGFEAFRLELGESPPDSPDGGMPEPDMLLGCSAACDPRYKWYQAMGRYRDTPIYNFDVVIPAIESDLDRIGGYYIDYQTKQFEGLVKFLENQTGKALDHDRLDRIIEISDETYRIWWECYQMRKTIPCPMPSEDHFNAFVPAFFCLGDEQTLNFYKELQDEVKERADNGEGVIPYEQYRLLWAGGLPPWHTMWIFNYFESRGAVFVMETAYRPWEPLTLPSRIVNPLEKLSWRHFMRRTSRFKESMRGSGDPMVELILEFIEEYAIDGLVMHATRSCRATTIGQKHLKNMLQRYVKVPILILQSDMVDLRDYSETQWLNQIDAFLEILSSRKTGQWGKIKC